MRILIMSDIHANLPALEAVLTSAGEVDAVWCLGDLVGYGPDPNQCVERVRNLPNLVCLLGNHDAAALGQIDIDNFNTDARASMVWSQTELTEESKAFLGQLPEQVVQGPVTLVHGSPRNPVWEYILDARTATINFEYFHTSFCLVGHTHLPVLYLQTNPGERARPVPAFRYQDQPVPMRAILNPGSVGQPRDRDSRAAFALFDPDAGRWEQHRVDYDLVSVQTRILKAGLPGRHALRLAEGW
jgi:predicted phosphodiesterase